MDVRTYRRRLLAPFHGMLQVVEVRGGTAETSDGRQWKLYVADEAIVSHTGLSEIQYGSWTANGGRARARVRGTCCSNLIEETGEDLITALEAYAARVPFPARDVHELWLLDADAGMPLALLETAMDAASRGSADAPRWLPGAAAKSEFASGFGDAETLVGLISRAAGRRPRAEWVAREPSGAGRAGDGRAISARRFPDLFLRTEWGTPEDSGLVRDFLRWQAPWLLQLTGLQPDTRAWLEAAAWERPLATSKAFRLYPRVLDREGLRIARVKAQLMGDAPRPEALAEPFYPFYIE
jgi:hypothetical protein